MYLGFVNVQYIAIDIKSGCAQFDSCGRSLDIADVWVQCDATTGSKIFDSMLSCYSPEVSKAIFEVYDVLHRDWREPLDDPLEHIRLVLLRAI